MVGGTNIFLAIYCRKLSATVHIISRVNHDWNLEAIHRAGADFALSHGSLAVQMLTAMVREHDLIVLGEGTELFVERTPPRLCGKPLADSEIRATTGLNVVAIREGDRLSPNPLPTHVLSEGSELVMIGSAAQRLDFLDLDASS